MFIFVSNESQGNVYFDNLTIQHTPGNLLEEHHYYPTGLEMFALSSSASNGHVRNRYGYQGQERENTFALNLNEFEARHYDPQTGRWMVTDPANQFPSPYVGMGNQWVSGVDPDGRLAWFVPVIIGAAIGGTAGGIIAHNNGQEWWKGAITGALVGAAAGLGVSAAIGPAGGITGITVGNSTAATAQLTKAWGITSTAIQSANINMGLSALQGGTLDNIYKSGLVGAASGAFTASGGFGMVNAWGSKSSTAQFMGRQFFQGIGTAGRSIGNNWAAGRNIFSNVSIGVGPINLTVGKGQNLIQWQNNIGNIATNAFGIVNVAFKGSAEFNWEHLSPIYGGGLIDKYFGGTWGAHSVLYRTDQFKQQGNNLLNHEFHHIWQSRSMGDSYLANYAGQSFLSLLMGKSFKLNNGAGYLNYFENLAYYFKWFK